MVIRPLYSLLFPILQMKSSNKACFEWVLFTLFSQKVLFIKFLLNCSRFTQFQPVFSPK